MPLFRMVSHWHAFAIVMPQSGNLPPRKSFSVAPSDCDVRVSIRKLAKHGRFVTPSTFLKISVRSIPPVKNVCVGIQAVPAGVPAGQVPAALTTEGHGSAMGN